MRAIVIGRNGGSEVLDVADVPAPSPGEGELLVDVAAAGVNFRDVYEREGRGAAYQSDSFPAIIGVEGAGTVVEGAGDFSPGDRVAWCEAKGSYAEQVVVAADKAVAVPDGVDPELAAAVLLQGLTAHYLSTSAFEVQAGQDVLVHAAAGGVGLLLTQLVKLRGGRVIATTSSEAKAQLARAAGADETLGYDGFAERVKALTGGAGVAVVYDSIAKDTFEGSLESLARRGTLVLFGMASGPVPAFELERLRFGSKYVTRPGLPDFTVTREELVWRAGEVFGWIADGKLDVRVGGRYPLVEARQAHDDLEGRRSTGKLVLTP